MRAGSPSEPGEQLSGTARRGPGRSREAARRAPGRAARATRRTWRRLGPEQRVAAVGAVLLALSTLGPFSWIEAATLLVAAGVLLLVKQRSDQARFHLPFGDGIVIAAAGAWSAVLIVVRMVERPLGQSVLALVCAGLLMGAGVRERAKRPADDLPARSEHAADPAAGDSGVAP
jgi:hypothetical protein